MGILYDIHSIVMEASSKDDQKYMKSMSDSDKNQINGMHIQNLYASTLERRNIDFGDIPDSKGDIEKVKYYKNINETLDILTEIFRTNSINDSSVSDIKTCISNMKMLRPQFMNGFKMNHEFIIIMYNAMVMSIVDAATSVSTWYIDFITTMPGDTTVSFRNNKKRGLVALDNIKKFNAACESGSVTKALNYMVESGKKNFIGADDVLVGGVIIMALLSIVPLIREIIFFYYSSRVKLSDYLEAQATFLETNELGVKASKSKSPAEKKAILKKQDEAIRKMRKLSDKLAINDADTNDVVKKELKNENSMWSLDNIEKQITKQKMDIANGFSVV